MIREKYPDYYAAIGSYRKLLMKQESVNTAEMYDYFSRLEIRCRQLIKCDEIAQSSDASVSRMVLRIGEFVSDMRNMAKGIFEKEGDNLHRMFAELYDESASIVEGFEFAAVKYLSKLSKLSESASLIQRQTHFAKNHTKDAQKSNAAKMAWRQHRGSFEQGIKDFHKSAEGKSFHRNLSRFSKRSATESAFTHDDLMVTAKGISSLCTHIIIEMQNTITSSVGRVDEGVVGRVRGLQELYHIFNESLSCLVDAFLEDDKESVANVVDIVKDYYDITGAGDKYQGDTDGVDFEGQP